MSSDAAPQAPELEYLSQGDPDRPRRRWELVALVVAASLLAAASAALTIDWGVRNAEMNSLVTAIEGSEQAMKSVQDRVAEIVQPYQDGAPLTDDERQQVLDELSAAASDGYGRVTEAGDRVANVRIAPWQSRIVAARTAYLAHNQAWRDYLSAATSDPMEFFKPQPAVNDTFFAARGPLEAAVPSPTLYDLRARVAAIYADSDQADQGDQGGGQRTDWSGGPVLRLTTAS